MPYHLEYIAAREGLLDGLEALEEFLDNLVLIGAQAVYLWTGDGDFNIPAMTSDADLAIDARQLAPNPLIEEVLQSAGFMRGPNPGQWRNQSGIPLDLMVSEHQAGGGRRSAKIPPHDKQVARKGRGLAACLVDNCLQTIEPLGDESTRRPISVKVAGPAALVVAKCIKLKERFAEIERPGRGLSHNRVKPKDALDLYRLLTAIDLETLAAGFKSHSLEGTSATESQEALTFLKEFSASEESKLALLLGENFPDSEGQEVLRFVALVEELTEHMGS